MTAQPFTISVNGERREVSPGTALDTVVRSLVRSPSGVAAAVNETVVPRTGGRAPRSPRATGSRSSPRCRGAEP